MKYLTSILIAAIVLSVSAFAASLASDDAKALENRAKMIGAAFDAADVDTIVEMTHPSLFRLMGGREKMTEITKTAMAQLKSIGVEVVESKLGVPTEVHIAADELVCFYPRTTVMRIGEKKAKSTGFLICVRKADAGKWLFLDGSGLRKNSELLGMLLPALAADVTLPENKVELVQ